MTLDRFRSVADRAIAPFVAAAERVGLTPDGVSVVAFAAAAAAGLCFAFAGDDATLYPVGALLVVINGWLDVLDGALARELGTDSRAGDLLDHVLDRYADIVVIAGLAAGISRYGVGIAAVTGVLMTSYLGTQAQAVDLDRVYGGLLGRADRLVLVTAVTAVTPFVDLAAAGLGPVGWLLVLFAVVGHLTALQRFYLSMRALG
jgi:archaetidylinositol phosphate synthase